MSKKVINLEALNSLNDREFATVATKFGIFRLQTLTAAEIFETEQWAGKKNKEAEEEGLDSVGYEGASLVAMLVDEDGHRLFPPSKIEEGYQRLFNLSMPVNNALIRAARDLHRLPQVQGDNEEVIEELAKNSETPPDLISSSLPEGSEELTPIS